jgi:hypothetical protein
MAEILQERRMCVVMASRRHLGGRSKTAHTRAEAAYFVGQLVYHRRRRFRRRSVR